MNRRRFLQGMAAAFGVAALPGRLSAVSHASPDVLTIDHVLEIARIFEENAMLQGPATLIIPSKHMAELAAMAGELPEGVQCQEVLPA